MPTTTTESMNEPTHNLIVELTGLLGVTGINPPLSAENGRRDHAPQSPQCSDRGAGGGSYPYKTFAGSSSSDASARSSNTPPLSGPVMGASGVNTFDSEEWRSSNVPKDEDVGTGGQHFSSSFYGPVEFDKDEEEERKRQIRLTEESGEGRSDSPGLGSHSSETSSLRSGSPVQSVYSFHSSVDGYLLREVHGRTLNSSNVNYMLPADGEEQSRLDLQHNALTLFLGNLYPWSHVVEPALQPRKGYTHGILDIGTGSGLWALSMAQKYPHAEVIGLDLVPPLVALEKIPDNCRFEIDDANLSMSHYEKCFDLVHVRAAELGIKDFSEFLYNVAQTLRPGGILVLGTGDPQFYDERKQACIATGEGRPGFRWVQKFFAATLEAHKNTCDFIHKDRLWTGWLENNPNYRSIQTSTMKLPLGPWPRGLSRDHYQAAIMLRTNFIRILDSFMPLLLQDGYLPEVAERWKKEAEREIVEMKVHTYVNYTWTVAQRVPDGVWHPPPTDSDSDTH
ncbi:hypothetical protein FRB95_002175 [Tulasnella sp. JGI-2019a]|nr:hypothetical protein FRB95_002175 [Tulasnella sp. JGI-2019a]